MLTSSRCYLSTRDTVPTIQSIAEYGRVYIGCCFCISVMVALIGVKLCVMVHINLGHEVSPFGVGIPKQPQMGGGQKMEIFGNIGLSESHLTANISKTVSRVN